MHRCRGIDPRRSCISFMIVRGIIPRVPPPSIHRTPAPAVRGRVRTVISSLVSWSQRKQRWILNTQASSAQPVPKTIIQFSHMQCPHGMQYCGLLRRQQRQVLLLRMSCKLFRNRMILDLCSSTAEVLPPPQAYWWKDRLIWNRTMLIKSFISIVETFGLITTPLRTHL
jgi:hypothetical protein